MAGDASEKIPFDIPRQRADLALVEFARQADVTFIFPYEEARQKTANRLVGTYTPERAIKILLEGTGLRPELNNRGAMTVRSSGHSATRGDVMNNKGKGILAGVAAAILSVFTTQSVTAQEDTEGQARSKSRPPLEEVIVTAQKREQSVFDVPMSVVALSGEELDVRKLFDFEDLGLSVPGLEVQDNGNIRRVFIRGVGSTSGSSSPIGLYLDEVTLLGGNPAVQPDLRIYDLERVEVLRGPQGTLYGQGSMGGTIRFITKNPQLDRFATKADIAASFTEAGTPSQKIQGVVNVPLVDEKLGLRVAGTFENAGGWIDQPAVSQNDINDQNLVDVRVKGLWQPIEALQVNAMALIHRNELGATKMGEDNDGNYTQLFNQPTTPSGDDDYDIYSLSLSYDFESISLLNTVSYSEADKHLKEVGNVCCGGISILYSSLNYVNDIFTNELRLSSNDSGPWHWTLGVFYQDAEAKTLATVSVGLTGDPIPPAFNLGIKDTSESWAVFGDTSFAITERFEIGGGLRYFEDKRTSVTVFTASFAGAPVEKASFDTLNPRVYLNYDLTEQAKAYASVAKGFRSGGLNAAGLPPFDPEKVWTYEVGTKVSLLDGKLEAEAALFYSDYKDYVIFGLVVLPGGGAVDTLSNAGDATIKGIDGSLTWRVTDQLTFGFSGNYLDTEFDEIRVTGTPLSVGDRLDFIPKYQYGIFANYDFLWGGRPGFARLDYNQQGRSKDIANESTVSSDVINMLNLHVRWEWSDNLSFGAFVDNLLDERGFISPDADLLYAARPRPRTAGFEIVVDF